MDFNRSVSLTNKLCSAHHTYRARRVTYRTNCQVKVTRLIFIFHILNTEYCTFVTFVKRIIDKLMCSNAISVIELLTTTSCQYHYHNTHCYKKHIPGEMQFLNCT